MMVAVVLDALVNMLIVVIGGAFVSLVADVTVAVV